MPFAGAPPESITPDTEALSRDRLFGCVGVLSLELDEQDA
jgi:hypothetical protein